ncbi:MAG: hypothetical protein KGK08_06455 [Acidobacteriota bacterium]|nr:hypothetical protein [Acidobacteriota bacterium]
MRPLLVLLLSVGLTSSTFAASKVSVEQLDQMLAVNQGKPDAEVAHQLAGVELTECLSSVRLQQLQKEFPGAATQGALMQLADLSAFLPLPASEVARDPTPDASSLRQMLDKLAAYVNLTVRQLPNFTATRTTTGFEDSPAVDVLGQTGVTSYSYLPMHLEGSSSVRVLYHDRREELDPAYKKDHKHEAKIQGLRTSGEFGPILSLILADALAGRITWGQWERNSAGNRAVFHFAVPDGKSHYTVQFCCTTDLRGESHIYSQTPPYHGEIVFDPATGTIFRIVAEADLLTGDLVSQAGILVEYGPLEIGAKTVVVASKSVSILRADTAPQAASSNSATSHRGTPKTFLNDVAFSQYHEFRAEAHIVTDPDQGLYSPFAPVPADSPGGNPSRTASHLQ